MVCAHPLAQLNVGARKPKPKDCVNAGQSQVRWVLAYHPGGHLLWRKRIYQLSEVTEEVWAFIEFSN